MIYYGYWLSYGPEQLSRMRWRVRLAIPRKISFGVDRAPEGLTDESRARVARDLSKAISRNKEKRICINKK
jgi:hypothetical protein